MTARAASLVAAAALVGCGGDGDIPGAEARRVADDFAKAMVEDHDEARAARNATRRIRADVDDWIVYLRASGVERVERGALRRNCVRPFPVFATAEPGDCFAYAVSGRGGTARLRLWMTEADDGWRVSYVDFTPRVGEA